MSRSSKIRCPNPSATGFWIWASKGLFSFYYIENIEEVVMKIGAIYLHGILSLLVLIFISPTCINAQQGNFWAFGLHGGLNMELIKHFRLPGQFVILRIRLCNLE
ncbi:MAG: hypothetical protein BRD49_06195 [Bacteroidetes bacterium SW_10_40_5]|nr:MAG: hypothetical protein BRD49_06195 [Bacteroidetes bacterium SW_10_40_5]